MCLQEPCFSFERRGGLILQRLERQTKEVESFLRLLLLRHCFNVSYHDLRSQLRGGF